MLLLLLLLLLLMLVMTTATVVVVVVCTAATAAAVAVLLLLYPLLQVNLGVAFLLVRPGELAAADIAGEGFLTGVRPDVGG